MSRCHLAANLGVALVAAFLLISGLSKLADLPEFARALASWSIIPRALHPSVVVVVPALEFALGALWLLGVWRRFCLLAMMLVIGAFTVALAIQIALTGPVSCGCLGAIARHFQLEESSRVAFTRNAVLLLLLVPGLFLVFRPGTPSPVSPAKAAARPGFTLIETILSVALVAILMSLLLPSLAGLRTSGRLAASTANARTHATTMATYLNDWRDAFPYLTDPTATQSVIRCRSAGQAITTEYFGGARFWWLGLADDYYDGNWLSPSFRSPFALPGVTGSYTMGCVFLAHPDYYTPETRRPPPEQLRPTRGADVLFPTSKAIIVDNSEPGAGISRHERSVIAAMVDTRAANFKTASDMLPQMPSGDGDYPALGADFPWWLPMTHTLQGVRGRDVR